MYRCRWPSIDRAIALLGIALIPSFAAAQEEDPLAVIDWLTRPPLDIPVIPPDATPVAKPPVDEPPVTDDATRPRVQVQPLGAVTPDAAGLLAPGVTGFPLTLWRGTGFDTLTPLLQALDTGASPVMQRLMLRLLLAEANPPLGVPTAGAFLAARADKLKAMGAVDQALALVERAGIDGPDLFDVYFDLALLTDQTDAACTRLAAAPHLARDYAARVFCLARDGDWQAAATVLNTAALLGAISDDRAQLLALFLDPELAEEVDPPAIPRRPTPLDVRLYEALGLPIAPTDLPPGHSVRDLGGDAGWKAQIDAAERLTAVGALPPSRLFGFYLARRPSASGGVWDRVAAVQRLQTALDEGRDAAAGAALLRAWPMMRDARLDGAFAQHMAPALLNANLSGAAREVALDVTLLSDMYETAAAGLATGERAFAAALATGDSPGMDKAAATATEKAVARGFGTLPLPPALASLREEGKLGELILRAMALYLAGQTGDPREAGDAIATFRAVGLEDVARQAGFELLLLDRGA
ncbi:hypothetical protein [Pseudaestuariivita atlantica]|uniref:hypothetical protein n=1 Tax=Pseudaestuariivita atlantica TaxID=1317121 RepID=UPI00067CB554|nr:hypothetical protein [Pseudaestuariivita atlantica]